MIWCLTISQIGLGIDIVGVLVLAFFNTPSEVMNREGLHYQVNNLGPDDPRTISEKKKFKVYRSLTLIGYALLITGFVLQFIAAGAR